MHFIYNWKRKSTFLMNTSKDNMSSTSIWLMNNCFLLHDYFFDKSYFNYKIMVNLATITKALSCFVLKNE